MNWKSFYYAVIICTCSFYLGLILGDFIRTHKQVKIIEVKTK